MKHRVLPCAWVVFAMVLGPPARREGADAREQNRLAGRQSRVGMFVGDPV